MAVWPPSLPQSFNVGLTESAQQGFVRTQMDSGVAKQRQRFTAVTRFIDEPDMRFDATQMSVFQTFYDDTLGFGSDSFEWLDPRDNATAKTMRFVEPPEVTYIDSNLYSVSMRLEIIP